MTTQRGAVSSHKPFDLDAYLDKHKGSRSRSYNFMSLKDVLKAEPFARAQGVSEVARSKRGFVRAYESANGKKSQMGNERTTGEAWVNRRTNFIKRHVAQLDKAWENGEPTRRHLALIMWAYTPTPAKTKKWLKASGSKAMWSGRAYVTMENFYDKEFQFNSPSGDVREANQKLLEVAGDDFMERGLEGWQEGDHEFRDIEGPLDVYPTDKTWLERELYEIPSLRTLKKGSSMKKCSHIRNRQLSLVQGCDSCDELDHHLESLGASLSDSLRGEGKGLLEPRAEVYLLGQGFVLIVPTEEELGPWMKKNGPEEFEITATPGWDRSTDLNIRAEANGEVVFDVLVPVDWTCNLNQDARLWRDAILHHWPAIKRALRGPSIRGGIGPSGSTNKKSTFSLRGLKKR